MKKCIMIKLVPCTGNQPMRGGCRRGRLLLTVEKGFSILVCTGGHRREAQSSALVISIACMKPYPVTFSLQIFVCFTLKIHYVNVRVCDSAVSRHHREGAGCHRMKGVGDDCLHSERYIMKWAI